MSDEDNRSHIGFKNSEYQYGQVSKFFHWLTMLIIFGLLALGSFMGDFPKGEFKGFLFGIHKSFGIMIIVITICRLLWFAFSKRPKPEKTIEIREVKIFKLIIIIFYFLLFAIPLSGWLRSSFAGYPVDFFGLFDVAAVVDKNKAIATYFKEIHEFLTTAIMVVIGLHFLAAMRHHFMLKDNVLKRMLP